MKVVPLYFMIFIIRLVKSGRSYQHLPYLFDWGFVEWAFPTLLHCVVQPFQAYGTTKTNELLSLDDSNDWTYILPILIDK
jgi:hypothetical protein